MNTTPVEFEWIVEGKSLGTCVVDRGTKFRLHPDAIHKLCPFCGRVWAKRIPTNPSTPVFHSAHSAPCPSCGVTASLALLRGDLRDLPRAALEWELSSALSSPREYAYCSRSRKQKES